MDSKTLDRELATLGRRIEKLLQADPTGSVCDEAYDLIVMFNHLGLPKTDEES